MSRYGVVGRWVNEPVRARLGSRRVLNQPSSYLSVIHATSHAVAAVVVYLPLQVPRPRMSARWSASSFPGTTTSDRTYERRPQARAPGRVRQEIWLGSARPRRVTSWLGDARRDGMTYCGMMWRKERWHVRLATVPPSVGGGRTNRCAGALAAGGWAPGPYHHGECAFVSTVTTSTRMTQEKNARVSWGRSCV